MVITFWFFYKCDDIGDYSLLVWGSGWVTVILHHFVWWLIK